MLVQRLRRWPSFKSAMGQRLVFSGYAYSVQWKSWRTLPENKRQSTINAVLVLVQRLWRWPNTTQTSDKRLCLLGIIVINNFGLPYDPLAYSRQTLNTDTNAPSELTHCLQCRPSIGLALSRCLVFPWLLAIIKTCVSSEPGGRRKYSVYLP